MMLYCRLLGAVLLVCTGFAAGQAYCQRLWAQWRAVCGFERLLTYLADQLAFCALPSAELLPPRRNTRRLPPTARRMLHPLRNYAYPRRLIKPAERSCMPGCTPLPCAAGSRPRRPCARWPPCATAPPKASMPPPSRPLYLPLNWDFAAGCWRPFCSGPRGEAGDN